ncbi:MAG: ORF6N domain-containing protein [Opitutaceae bacterium]|nr:ORF6N domain-containing protein [Opitutaceae bacterium]
MARARTKPEPALPRIFTVRKMKVVLDADLAGLYGVLTKRLNEAVKRNPTRFPVVFSFILTEDEVENLRSQFATSSSQGDSVLRSQFATLKTDGRGKHRKYLPRVFTEHGALMAANVLRSERAVQMSLYLVRAFIEMRDAILANSGILRRLSEIDRRLIEHDSVLRELVERLQVLLDAPPVEEPAPPKIGFHQGNR